MPKASKPAKAAQETTPDITILIPAYNAEESIARTIHSVRLQTNVKAEILVADDFSTDDTAEAAADSGATVFTMPQNIGPAAALNAIAPNARGRYVMTLEADDRLELDGLGALVDALDAGADFAYGWTQYHGMETHLFKPRAPHDNAHFMQRFESLYAVMFRRQAFDFSQWHTFAAGYGLHDYDFTLQLIEHDYLGAAVQALVLHYDYQPSGLAQRMAARHDDYLAELRSRHPELKVSRLW